MSYRSRSCLAHVFWRNRFIDVFMLNRYAAVEGVVLVGVYGINSIHEDNSRGKQQT